MHWAGVKVNKCFYLKNKKMFSIISRCNKQAYVQLRDKCFRQYSNGKNYTFPRERKHLQRNNKNDEFHNIFEDLTYFSTTQNWRNVATEIKEQGIKCTRSSLQIYNNLAEKAFHEADLEIGWEMFKKINDGNFQPHCKSFQAYWDYCSVNRGTFVKNIENMFEFIGKNKVIISKDVIDDLSHMIQHFGGTSVITKLNNEIICENCQQHLDQLKQSTLEFKNLKQDFENIILKPKISSIDLSIFRQIVNKKKTYDYIIDSLNVSRTFPDSKGNIYKQGKIVENIVKELKSHNKKVLVVGKKHVNTWPEQSTNFIRNNATVFFTNNKGSNDDIFMLYASLLSGQNSYFVTNDLLTDYIELFSESGKDRFIKWQNLHQHWVSYDHKVDAVRIHKPSKFAHNANKSLKDGRWHIPFTTKPILSLLVGPVHPPIEWACIELRNQ